MPAKLWDIDVDYNPQNYVLYGGQRAYLSPYHTAYENGSGPYKAIQQRAEAIPDRIQDLMDDITLLEHNDYLKHTSWDELVDLEPRAISTFNSGTSLSEVEEESETIELGFEIGSIFKALMEVDNNEDVWPEFIWGIILAFAARERGQIEKERQEIEQFIFEINRLFIRRRTYSNRLDRGVEFFFQRQKEGREELASAIEKEGIEPMGILIGWVDDKVQETSNTGRDGVVKDVLDEELPEEEFHWAMKIRSELQDDEEEMTNGSKDSNVYGLDKLNAFEEIWKQEGPLPEAKIAMRCGLSSTATNLVTGILNGLSDTMDKELWMNHPVVVRTDSGWNTTDYGELLGYILFVHGLYEPGTSPLEWPVKYALEPEKIYEEEIYDIVENLRDEVPLQNEKYS